MIEYTVRVSADGYTSWWLNDKLHREDGPAVEHADGYKSWWLNGKQHREDGPAIECADGYKSWWLNSKRHREDGPAIECANGYKSWYLNDNPMTEEEHKAAMNPAVEMTVEEICKALGKNVKVVK
jgi:hypothetical protein